MRKHHREEESYMKKMLRWRVLLPSIAVVALTAVGVAVAGGVGSVSQLSQTTFVAQTVTHKDVRTCTGTDGTYEITHATFTGTATNASDPRLNGTVEIDVKSAINTTKNLGTVDGRFDVNSSTAGDDAHGKFSAVYAAGQLSGLASGNLDSPHAKLLGIVAGPFSSSTGFSSLVLGGGTATNVAIAYGGSCDNGKHDDHADKSAKPDKHGNSNKHDD
jgi:hypothetical protein